MIANTHNSYYNKQVNNMKHRLFFLTVAVISLTAFSCGRNTAKDYGLKYSTDREIQELINIMPDYPRTKFAVFSDPHYYDRSLGITGDAFQAYLATDRKLLHLSEEILDTALGRIADEKPDFVIVSGDLTKDGERINHEKVSRKLEALLKKVPRVVVVPGNHDVMNYNAHSYSGSGMKPVESITPADFKKFYRNAGYGDSVAEDKTSLSYVSEPVKGLWILALDSCLWRDNKPGEHPVTDGEFSPDTMRWIEDMLIKSKTEKKAIIAVMHHGIMEHYPYNEKYYGEYIVNNNETVSDMFAAYGVRVVFTGHYHAQDITLKKKDSTGKFVYDIETGSLVTYPSPFRVVTIDRNQKLHISSHFINSIPSKGTGFQNYNHEFLYDSTVKIADTTLRKFKVSGDDMKVLSPAIARAYAVNLAGDEVKPVNAVPDSGLGIMGTIVMKVKGKMLEGWYTDLPPADNNITVDLKNGEWQK